MLGSDRTATIHALSSGAPPAGVGIIRVSGPLVPDLVRSWIGRSLIPRHATLVTLTGADGEPLDDAMALHFPAPRSFTGEDVLELHCHGGPAVIAAVTARLHHLGTRPAEPGEFTYRAHLNGRIDLIEAERLADVIDAETEAQRAFAVSDRGRVNAALYASWRAQLIDMRALMEAMIDFPDEDDAPIDVAPEVYGRVGDLIRGIEAHLAGARSGEIVRAGYRLVLAGAPNAGKSSLLNALAGRDVAIVSPHAGTTRDVVEVVMDLQGYRVVVSDTAGLRRNPGDPVESLGIERTVERTGSADGTLWLIAPDNAADSPDDGDPLSLLEVEPVLTVATKADLDNGRIPTIADCRVSARTGEGMDALLNRLAAIVARQVPEPAQSVPVAKRHVSHLERALVHLRMILPDPGDRLAVPAEIAAEHLRMAGDEIGRIGGEIGIEHVYDAVFSRFCMGK